jgi:hypothetical protein
MLFLAAACQKTVKNNFGEITYKVDFRLCTYFFVWLHCEGHNFRCVFFSLSLMYQVGCGQCPQAESTYIVSFMMLISDKIIFCTNTKRYMLNYV